ncbi:DUF416 family protein [Oceanicoccus sagamiensis]|uniref:DUF416 domain-containing protein n=1 Tax=Oceanicoccus sagamiensis TaxID=716816 RepID=A0A1X9NDM4_9GAMM|nr:DUF416 family protein [Oceanicoccus sagamiensis]ARN75666.1 hypothetical protein BST96_17060 [Oceanicoccus sagamiensis]
MKKRSNSEVVAAEWRKIAFATAMVSRMTGNYRLFCELTEAGDSAAFVNIVNLVWEFAAGQNQRIDFQKQQEKLELITPDPAAFDMYGVWPALDAAVALAALLSACERWDESELDAIVTLSMSTIDNYLQAVEATEGEAHPLVLAEQACIEQLNAVIAQGGNLSRPQLIGALKAAVKDFEVTNIGLEA